MEFDLKEYMKMLKKRVFLIAAIVLLSCILVAINNTYLSKPHYEANYKLFVTIDNDVTQTKQVPEDVDAGIRLISIYKELIISPSILQTVVIEHPELHLSLEELSSMINLSPIPDAPMMNIIVTSNNYKESVDVIAALMNVFIKEANDIVTIGKITVINETSDKPEPIKPNDIVTIGLAFIVSLVFSLGLVSLLEHMDDSIKSEKDVENILGVRNLANIEYSKTKEVVKNAKVKKVRKPLGESIHADINQ